MAEVDDFQSQSMAGWTGASIHLDGATTVDNLKTVGHMIILKLITYHLWLVVGLAMSVLVQRIHEHLAKVLAGLQVRAFVLR